MTSVIRSGPGNLPAQAGNAGKYLKTNGSGLAWDTPAGGGGSTVSYQPTAPSSPVNGQVWVDSDDVVATAAAIPSLTGQAGKYLTNDGSSMSWGTIAASSGVDLITAQSFSAVASVSVASAFSSTYQNYRVILTAAHSAGAVDLNMRLRAGTTDETGSVYARASYGANMPGGGTYDAEGAGATSSVYLRRFGGTNKNLWVMDIAMPNDADWTWITWQGADAAVYAITGTSIVKTSTAYDGLSLIAASGTFSGDVRVYGMKN